MLEHRLDDLVRSGNARDNAGGNFATWHWRWLSLALWAPLPLPAGTSKISNLNVHGSFCANLLPRIVAELP
jgi:hypothetical protein